MSAKQNYVFVLQKPEHFALLKSFALGRHIHAVRLVLGVYRLYSRTDGLRRHYHTGTAAKRIIVALEVLVFGIVADIYDIYLYFAAILRPAQYAFAKGRKHFGEQR